MKKLLVLCLLLIGCNNISKEEVNQISTEYINDYVFKNKCDINIHKLEVLDIQYTDSRKLDSVEIALKKNLLAFLSGEYDKQKKIITDLKVLPIDFELLSYTERSKKELNEEMAKIIENENFYKKQHEQDLQEIKNRKPQKNITYAKVLLKATVGCYKTKNKYYDTLNVFIDHNKKVIPSEISYLYLTVYDTTLL